MKFTPITLGVAALVLLAMPLAARADLIPWMYNWSRSPEEIHADAPGTGYITLTDESMRSAVGESDIVATNLKTFSTATSDNPDTFTNQPYTLYLFLQDAMSGEGQLLDFTGVINGQLTAGSANLVSTPTGLTTRTVTLGGNEYTVSVTSYTPPGVPGSFNVGSISAHIKVKGGTPIVANLPEPSSLMLTGVGVCLLAASRWRAGFSARRRGR